MISAASRAASPAKLTSASASSTMVRASAGLVSAAATSLRNVGPTPAPGPSAIARRRSSASSASNSRAFANGATITAVSCAALTATASGGLATLTMPAPARSAARAASRAAPVWWPEPDRTSTAPRAYLWLSAPACGSAARQTAGALTKACGAMGPSAASGMPMSASRISPASVRPGSNRWPGLRRKKVTLALASTAAPRDLAGFPVDPGGNVDGEHATAGAGEIVDTLDDRLRLAIDVAGKSRPEQRVDHAVGLGEVNRSGVEDRSLVASGGERRIAFQGLAAAEQSELDRIAAHRQEPRGDEAVAAVAAGAAEDGDPAARLREPRRFVSDRETRPLHERNARRSGRNRKAVGPAHFSWRQQLRICSGIAHGRQRARR